MDELGDISGVSGEIMEDYCIIVRYHGGKFIMAGDVNGYYSVKNNSWKIRTIMDAMGDRYLYKGDWMNFISEVYSRDDIPHGVFTRWILEEMRMGIPPVTFEAI